VDEAAAAAGEFKGLIAAPMFHSALALTEGMPYLNIKYGTMGIAAGHDCEFHRQIRPGDVLTISCCVEDIYEKTGRSGSMLFIIRKATFRDREGRDVVTVRHKQILK
jgi:acyl dehydratase